MRSEGKPLRDLEGMLWTGDIPVQFAALWPDKAAVIVPEAGRTLSYGQMDAATQAFVEQMEILGARAGDRIAYYGRNNDLYFPALFGCILGGFVLLPLNWRCAAPEIGFMIQDAGPALIIVDAEFAPVLELALTAVEAERPLTLLTEGPESLRERLEIPATGRRSAAHDPEQICLQMYTSGTTGRPKGVLCTHGGLSYARHSELVSDDWTDWNADDVILSPLPNFHIGGMSFVLIGMVRGITCVVTADASIGNILDVIEAYGVTRTFIVPTVVRAILDNLKDTGRSPPPIRTITYGAAVMSEALLTEALQVLGCTFGQYFGMTEVTGTVTFLPARDHDLNRPHILRSVGRPQCGMAIEIRDENGQVLPAGQAGEIWARTPTIMAGYLGLPEATAKAIVDGWYRTGDGGRLDEDGYLYITDRIRDMIISGGENIYPAQVEEVVRQHPAVQDVAVVGMPDPRWGETVVAVVELRPGADTTAEEIIDHARQNLARFKCPKAVRFVPALPRTAMGKVQRVAVRSNLLSEAS